jgi:hypothetical protein
MSETTYTWTFPRLDAAPAIDGLSNVVRTVHWRLTATRDGVADIAYGSVELPPPDPQDFTPFEHVSKEQVIEWTEEAIEAQQEGQVANIKAALEKSLNGQLAPPLVTLTPSWG